VNSGYGARIVMGGAMSSVLMAKVLVDLCVISVRLADLIVNCFLIGCSVFDSELLLY
jgi:hypothetical protein